MKKWYLYIAVGATVFVLLSVVWLNAVTSSDITRALRKLGRSERDYLEARQALMLTTGDPVPGLLKVLQNPRTRPKARLHAVRLTRELAARRDLKPLAAGVATVLADTNRALWLEALYALQALKSTDGLQEAARICREEQDTALIRAAVRAMQAGAMAVRVRLGNAVRERDTVAVDSCVKVLDSLPTVNSFAADELGRFYATRGDSARSLECYRAAGSVCSFWAVGSFVARNASAFHVPYAPEQGPFDTTQEFDDGDGARVRWVPVRRPVQDAFVDLNNLFTQRYSGAAYFVTFLRTPVARDALLLITTPDGSKVFLNDSLVFDNRVFGFEGPERDIAPITLRPGCNKLMIKNTQDHGGDWWQWCRLVGRDGWAMPDVEVSLTPCPAGDR